jgi:hypothetical protein
MRFGSGTRRSATTGLRLREYEDLVRWARDVHREEGRALDAVEERARQRGIAGPGLGQQEQREVRDAFAQRWRDRKSAADRALDDLRDSENVLHRRWRNIVRRPWPENPHREELWRLTQGWEARAR